MITKKAAKVKVPPKAKPETKKAADKPKRQAEEKWGAASMAAGYTIVPNVLLQRHQQIGLDAVDLSLVLQLASYWWTAGKKPFPGKRLLAKGVGRDLSVVRKRLQKMEKDGLLRRIYRTHERGGNNTNEYDLSPLAKVVARIARDDLAIKDKARLALIGRKSLARPLAKK